MRPPSSSGGFDALLRKVHGTGNQDRFCKIKHLSWNRQIFRTDNCCFLEVMLPLVVFSKRGNRSKKEKKEKNPLRLCVGVYVGVFPDFVFLGWWENRRIYGQEWKVTLDTVRGNVLLGERIPLTVSSVTFRNADKYVMLCAFCCQLRSLVGMALDEEHILFVKTFHQVQGVIRARLDEEQILFVKTLDAVW